MSQETVMHHILAEGQHLWRYRVTLQVLRTLRLYLLPEHSAALYTYCITYLGHTGSLLKT